MTPSLALLLVPLAAVVLLVLARAVAALARFVADDGTTDLRGHLRRPAAFCLPSSHHDPVPTHPAAFLR